MDLVLVSFVVYTVIIIAIGIFSIRFAKKTASDFFLADRGLGAWVAGPAVGRRKPAKRQSNM